ncbi:MAG: response regulator, partial [Polyangiaceae bacterium]|nr:response regulator [Polyangiaceae bacterium]
MKELVMAHEGTVSIDSAVGQGSELTVRIPLGAEASSSEGDEAMRALRPRPLASYDDLLAPVPTEHVDGIDDRARSRVLVADDNADMREYLRRLLAPHYIVDLATDGATALARSRERTPDAVIADVMMPGMSGFGLVRALRDAPATRSVPVLLVSARAGEEAAIEGLESGADDYLVKPFSARELLTRVASQVRMARTRRDFADREALLRTLEHERARLADVLAGLPVGVALAEAPSGRIVLVNRELERIVRPSFFVTDAVEALTAWRFVKPDGRPIPLAEWPLVRALAGEEVAGVELTLDHDGERRVVRMGAAPIRDPSGEILAAVTGVTDITETVAARADLERSEARYRSLVRATAQIVFMADADGRLRLPVAAWKEFTGVDGDDSALMFEAIHPEDRERVLDAWA